MKTTKYVLASSAVTLALLVAAPVLADSDHRGSWQKGDSEFRAGVLTRLFHSDNRDNEHRNENADRDKRDREDRDERRSATSTLNSSVVIVGTISAINGSQLTVTGNNGTTYTVDAANAALNGSLGAVVLGDLRVGDTIVVRGKLNGTALTANTIRDISLAQRLFVSTIGATGAGVVTSISGNTFTINPIGNGATTTVTTNASTTYKVNGQATTSSALAVGSNVIIGGTSTSDTSITASLVSIWNIGLGFLRHLFQ